MAACQGVEWSYSQIASERIVKSPVIKYFWTFDAVFNVTKLELRPIPDREFEFMFYFDLDTSIYSKEYIQLMCELEDLCEEVKYLGSYTEVV